MQTGKFSWGVLVALGTCLPMAGYTQDAANDQAAVWAAVEAIWNAEAREDNNDIDALLTDDFVGWTGDAPAPRNKSSSRMWREFDQDQTKTLQYELYPMLIVVHGNTAVAHYLYTSATEGSDKDVAQINGRFTDVLVRDNGIWMFLTWHGGAD